MILILACFSTLVLSHAAKVLEHDGNQAIEIRVEQFKIKKADLYSNLDQIVDTINLAYQRQSFNRKDYPRITMTALRNLIQDEENKFYIVISGKNEPCGTILLHHSEISLLSVHPDYHGQGLGLQLLQHAESEAFKTFKSVFLKVIPLFQENLIRYYESVGYKSFGEYESLSQEKLNRIQDQYHNKVFALILRKENPAISN